MCYSWKAAAGILSVLEPGGKSIAVMIVDSCMCSWMLQMTAVFTHIVDFLVSVAWLQSLYTGSVSGSAWCDANVSLPHSVSVAYMNCDGFARTYRSNLTPLESKFIQLWATSQTAPRMQPSLLNFWGSIPQENCIMLAIFISQHPNGLSWLKKLTVCFSILPSTNFCPGFNPKGSSEIIYFLIFAWSHTEAQKCTIRVIFLSLVKDALNICWFFGRKYYHFFLITLSLLHSNVKNVLIIFFYSGNLTVTGFTWIM